MACLFPGNLVCKDFMWSYLSLTSRLQQTSSASSKLLHGGIRYLEQGHFGLKESLYGTEPGG